MTFGNPWMLLAVPAVWLAILVATRLGQRQASLRYSGLGLLEGVPGGWRTQARRMMNIAWFVLVTLLAVALARPQVANTQEVVEGEGIDIALVLDISGSMRALDFEPQDRLAVAKEVLHEFIDGRKQDRMALVVFAAKAFTQCPLTLDYGVLHRFLDEVQIGLIDDGTAIGLGIATGVKRLSNSEATSRVLVLLTDGVNNVPTVDPVTAADAAKALGVKIYSVGVGKEGLAPYPVDHPVLGRRYTQIETHIDEDLLRSISEQTGGQYFRARTGEGLAEIFEVIDTLERSKVETIVYTNYRQLAPLLLLPALGLLLAVTALSATTFRVLP